MIDFDLLIERILFDEFYGDMAEHYKQRQDLVLNKNHLAKKEIKDVKLRLQDNLAFKWRVNKKPSQSSTTMASSNSY